LQINKPVFVSGYSRSGGTLMVTILDAHPEIAMSYELYPDMLMSLVEYPGTGFKRLFYRMLRKRMSAGRLVSLLKGSKDMKSASKRIPDKSLRTYVLRCQRGGLDNRELAWLLLLHINEGMAFSCVRERLKFIERCGLEKMKKTGKSHWGMKCTNQYDDYLAMWPNAYFINIIRDGRDVLASQMHTGSFDKDPTGIARGWVSTHMKFRKLVDDPRVNACEVYYEKLVSQPEEEVVKICQFLNVPFEKEMLDYYHKDLTIYSGAAGHLSLKRISKPIDNSMIGRWKKDLTGQQLDEFYSVAKEAMEAFGYMGEN